MCLLMATRCRWSPRSASCLFSSCRAISCRCSALCWWCLHWHRFRRPRDRFSDPKKPPEVDPPCAVVATEDDPAAEVVRVPPPDGDALLLLLW